MVTNGYVTPEARGEVFQFIDAANVDLKAFTEKFYSKLTLAHLDPVLDTLVWLKRETGVWIEITTLLIPGHNDSDDEIKRECGWVLENLGNETPLHFTAFHPDYRMIDIPRTPASTLLRARGLALKEGIRYAYVGNVLDHEGQTTWCPGCGAALIERDWHSVRKSRLEGNRCAECQTVIPGRFA
jgi:pyruvate formate lyase activating enzyme